MARDPSCRLARHGFRVALRPAALDKGDDSLSARVLLVRPTRCCPARTVGLLTDPQTLLAYFSLLSPCATSLI